MREVTMYECGLCYKLHGDKAKAHECESLGKETPLTEVGVMVDHEVKMGGGYDSFYIPVRVEEIEDKGHYLIYYFEQWDEEEKEWGECDYSLGNLYGNSRFEEMCTIK